MPIIWRANKQNGFMAKRTLLCTSSGGRQNTSLGHLLCAVSQMSSQALPKWFEISVLFYKFYKISAFVYSCFKACN